MGAYHGTDGADQIVGSDGADTLFGYGGEDELMGKKGDDLFVPGVEPGVPDAVYGYSGWDVVSYAGGSSVHVDLLSVPGYPSYGWSSTHADALYDIDGIIGSASADRIAGHQAANELFGMAGDDRLFGEEGDDRLSGGQGADLVAGQAGADTVWGGGGADRFVYTATGESTALSRDTIMDLRRTEGDRIDLAGVDAVTGVGGDQPFAVVGTAAFDAPGQVRYAHVGGDTVVQASTDADAAAEMEIRLEGTLSLAGQDFVF